MEDASFTLIWIGMALYALLAGADFGVGFWVALSHAMRRGGELRRDAFGYFGPVWEVNGLFLVFFMVGLMAAFPRALAVLSRALAPLVLAALVLFVIRSGAYALLHYGPQRSRAAATWVFVVSSVVAGVALGYAAAAPISGFMDADELGEGYYLSALAIGSAVLTLAASAHLSALTVAAYAAERGRETAEWFRWAALGAGP